MFSVLFEVLSAAGMKEDYLNLVQQLKPFLKEATDGYAGREGYASWLRPGWLLALQTSRDEKSIVRWRTENEHHAIQIKGRFEVFSDYHVRLGDTSFDTDPPTEAPIHELRFDETGKYVTVVEGTSANGMKIEAGELMTSVGLDFEDPSVVDHDIYDSISESGKFAIALAWAPMKKQPKSGCPKRSQAFLNCAVVVSASYEIIAASIGARHRNITMMSQREKTVVLGGEHHRIANKCSQGAPQKYTASS